MGNSLVSSRRDASRAKRRKNAVVPHSADSAARSPDNGMVRVTVQPSSEERGDATPPTTRSHDPTPGVNEEGAPDTAALKLRLLLAQLEKGDAPVVTEMCRTLAYAADVLSSSSKEKSPVEGKLEFVRDRQVREWLENTFTKRESTYNPPRHSLLPLYRFKAAANVIRIGQYIGNKRRESTMSFAPNLPQGVAEMFKKHLGSWGFDVFRLDELTERQPLRFMACALFRHHNLLQRCRISGTCFESLMAKIENGYGNHDNPYHNAIHGADVTQTVHYLIEATGLINYLSHLEVLSVLLAAVVHDVDHPGTTNSFQILDKSPYALLYNDRSVLENHHLNFAFTLLAEADCNILRSLDEEEYRVVRALVIDMVLATDMSFHFDHLKAMRTLMSAPDAGQQLVGPERSKMLCLLLHVADISHPCKPWPLHSRWTECLVLEFFAQGDRECRLGRPCSPLCDRHNTSIPDSQLGFMDFIVAPSLEVCGDMLELLLTQPPPSPVARETFDHAPNGLRVCQEHLSENKQLWTAKCKKKLSNGVQRDSTGSGSTRRGSAENCSLHRDSVGGASTPRGSCDGSEGRGGERVTTAEKVESKTVETRTVSKVETLQTPGGSEVKTITTVELCKVTTNEVITSSQ